MIIINNKICCTNIALELQSQPTHFKQAIGVHILLEVKRCMCIYYYRGHGGTHSTAGVIRYLLARF